MTLKKLYENPPLYLPVLRILNNKCHKIRRLRHPKRRLKWIIFLKRGKRKEREREREITHYALHGHPSAASAIWQKANPYHRKSVVWIAIHGLDVVGGKMNHTDHPTAQPPLLTSPKVDISLVKNTDNLTWGIKYLPQVLASMEFYSRKQ